MNREQLISDAYLEEQRILHAAPRGYGGRGDKWAPFVEELICKLDAGSVLDYGCGEGSLVRALAASPTVPVGVRLTEYDPAIAGKDAEPSGAHLVVCTDVLEHIESQCIHAVLTHLWELSGRALFAVISLVPTAKTLTNGKQAHILLRSVDWWQYQFEAHGFVLSKIVRGQDPKKDHKQFASVWKPCGK